LYQHAQYGTLFRTEPTLHDPILKRVPGIQIFEGLKKGVRVVDQKTAWLVVDMLRSTFYGSVDHQGNTMNMAEVYKQFVRGDRDEKGRRRFENHFKDVRMVVAYDTSRTIQFYSLSRAPIGDQQFYVNGSSVPDFFSQTHDIELQYTNLPGVHTSYQGFQKNIIYPLELLYVLPGQCIPQERALPEVSCFD
jgi:hypothetical protein